MNLDKNTMIFINVFMIMEMFTDSSNYIPNFYHYTVCMNYFLDIIIMNDMIVIRNLIIVLLTDDNDHDQNDF